MIKLYIDTDMGGDVDDALALVAALNSPNVELVGVGTVYLRAPWRAQVTKDLLHRYGRDIPVAAGCSRPMAGEWDEKNIPNSAETPGEEYPLSRLHAADLLLESLQEHPGLTILAIGPLTNLALALLKDPKAFRGSRIVMMGGRMDNAQPEWNIRCDPEAAAIVFGAGVPLTVVPFDITRLCQFTQAEVDGFGSSANLDLLREMMNRFTERFGFLPMMHDPMALAAITNPELFTFAERTIAVETAGIHTWGTLVDFGDTEKNNTRLVVAADQPAFRDWVKDILKK